MGTDPPWPVSEPRPVAAPSDPAHEPSSDRFVPPVMTPVQFAPLLPVTIELSSDSVPAPLCTDEPPAPEKVLARTDVAPPFERSAAAGAVLPWKVAFTIAVVPPRTATAPPAAVDDVLSRRATFVIAVVATVSRAAPPVAPPTRPSRMVRFAIESDDAGLVARSTCEVGAHAAHGRPLSSTWRPDPSIDTELVTTSGEAV